MGNMQDSSTDSFRDRLSTMDAKGKQKWVYAQQPKGRLYNMRTVVSWFFFVLFIGLPFIHIDGRPLFLFNIPHARFILFGKVFWPQDFFIFGLGMVTFVVFIVLFTAAFGRLFCGWVCPQTIFMEMVFRKIEYVIEGSAAYQQLQKGKPWTGGRLARRISKHIVFYLLSFVIANFFLSYIIGIKGLYTIITEPVGQHVGGLLSIALFSGVFYGVYAFFREQVCTVICPYGRLQGVLLDKNSMIVAYDYKRGEPRGKYSKKAALSTGDCIDCMQCVKVCPTAIDIRNGTQMECVGCTACIDACNKMMDAIGKPQGLIRYASENGIADHQPLRYTSRMKGYTVLLAALVVILGVLLVTRKDVDATVMRTPGMLYQERGLDSITNLYNIKIANKTTGNTALRLQLENMPGRIEVIGGHGIVLKQEEETAGTFFVVLPRQVLRERKLSIAIGLYDGKRRIDVIRTNFLGPGE